MGQATVCEEKHKYVDAKLEEHDNRLSIHGGQIDELKNNQVRTETIVQRVCDQISRLVDEMSSERESRHLEQKHLLWAIIGGFGGIIFFLLGFVFWYIQTIPV